VALCFGIRDVILLPKSEFVLTYWLYRSSLCLWQVIHSFIHSFISGSTVLLRTLAASHRRFRNLIKTLGRTPLDE
jgi:hypothetical protein